MDRAVTALHTADRALNALESLLALPPTTEIERDAAIQRFAYTFEVAWKAARAVPLPREGVAAFSPEGRCGPAAAPACRTRGARQHLTA